MTDLGPLSYRASVLRRSAHVITFCVSLGFPGSSAALTIVDTCNQVVFGAGVLAGDLDCTAVSGYAVEFPNPGSLDLAGFEIIGGGGVLCADSCTIFSSTSGGTIRDSTSNCVRSTGQKVTIENVTISGCGVDGIDLPKFSYREDEALVIDSTISGCAESGIDATNTKVVGSTIAGNADGIVLLEALRLIDSSVTGNLGAGVIAGLSPFDLTNDRGAKVLIRRSTVSGNGNGLVISGPVMFQDSAIDDNVGGGAVFDVHESRIKCRGSSFDRNGADGLLWQNTTFDVSASFKQCSANDNGQRGLYVDPLDSDLEKLVADGLTVTGNGDDGILGAIEPGAMIFKRSTISGTGGHGIANPQRFADTSCDVKLLTGSAVSGNGTLADCGITRACADVALCADGDVTIAGAACGTSYVLDSGIPGTSWGVCGAD